MPVIWRVNLFMSLRFRHADFKIWRNIFENCETVPSCKWLTVVIAFFWLGVCFVPPWPRDSLPWVLIYLLKFPARLISLFWSVLHPLSMGPSTNSSILTERLHHNYAEQSSKNMQTAVQVWSFFTASVILNSTTLLVAIWSISGLPLYCQYTIVTSN